MGCSYLFCLFCCLICLFAICFMVVLLFWLFGVVNLFMFGFIRWKVLCLLYFGVSFVWALFECGLRHLRV